MTDRTGAGRAVANNDGPSTPTGPPLTTPARELARRLSAADEVLLLWHPDTNRVELSIRDVASGADVRIEIAPGDAIDAFHHPYAYVDARDG
jgi:hypothetical protein